MAFINIVRRTFRALFLFLLFTLVAGAVGVFIMLSLLPRISEWPWANRLSFLRPLTQSVTVIEKTEQIVLSEEETIERFTAEPATAIVSILSVPLGRTNPLVSPALRQTGVLITNDGLVATYQPEAPVTENRRFTVFFSDGNSSTARFAFYDTLLNVAYFRTERADTPSVAFANSDDVRTGRRFVALSSTYDERSNRLTTGVIAQVDRTFNLSGKTVASTDEWEGVFRPDAKLDTNFVGGAAVAMNGDMLGLIGSLSIDNENQYFILPANALRQSLQRLIADPAREKRFFGAYYVSLTKELGLIYGVPRDRGALIYTPSEKSGLAVIAGSPAEKAGLRYGDIVIAVNGKEVNMDWSLSVALGATAPGETTTLLVIRNAQEISIPITF